MAKKIRADQLLVEQGLVETREKAKRLIMAGQALVGPGDSAEPITKPGQQLAPDAELRLREQDRFVSRGAHKLLTGMEEFKVDVTGFVCLDAGASTGGFTDCLLQHGAAKVYAVDVGYGQLHSKLRNDPRVVNMERTNLRFAEPDLIPDPVDLVVADVSFISLTMILPPCMQFVKPDGKILCLVKPQFELGPHQTEKGVVRDPELRQQAVDKICKFAAAELGMREVGCIASKIKGPKGNQEYMLYLERCPDSEPQ